MRALVVTGLLVLLIDCGCGKASAQATPELRIQDLPCAFTIAAGDPATGDVAIADAKAKKLWLLKAQWFHGKKDQVVGPVDIPEKLTSLIFKQHKDRRLLIAGSMGTVMLTILDAGTLEQVRRFPESPAPGSDGNGIRMLAVSEEKTDPFVYAAGVHFDGSGVFALSLAAPKIKVVRMHRYGSKARGAVPSRDGRSLFVYGEEFWVRQLELQAETSDAIPRSKSASHLRTGGPYNRPVLLRDGRVLVNQTLRPANLKDGMRLTFYSQCELRSRPFLAAIRGTEVLLVDVQSVQPAVVVPLPSDLRSPGDPVSFKTEYMSEAINPGVRLIDQSQRDSLLVLCGSRVGTLKLDNLRLANQPRQAKSVEITELLVGVPAEIPFEAEAGSQVLLDEPPTGMTLSGGVIRWTPTRDDIGRQNVKLTISRGGQSLSHEISLVVLPQTVKVPFKCDSVRVGPLGKRVVAWNSRAKAPRRLVLFDMEQLKVLADKETELDRITEIRVHPKAIVVVGDDGKEACVIAMNPDTLGVRAKLVATARPQFFGAGVIGRKGEKTAVYSLPRLQKTTNIEPPTKLGPDHYSDGILWDQSLKNPQLLTVDPTPPRRRHFSDVLSLRSDAPPELKHKIAVPAVSRYVNLMARSNASRRFELFLRPGAGLRSLADEAKAGRDRRSRSAAPERQNQNVEDLLLSSYRLKGGKFTTARRSVHICGHINGMHMALLSDRSLQLTNLGSLFEGSDAPPRLRRRQSVFVTDGSDPTRLRYEIEGGKPPYQLKVAFAAFAHQRRLDLKGSDELIRAVDSAENEVDVDFLEFARRRLADLIKPIAQQTRDQSALATVDRYVKGLPIREISRGRVDGAPFRVRVTVTVTDADGLTDSFSHYVYVSVPRKEVLLAVNEWIVANRSGAAAETARKWIKQNRSRVKRSAK